MAKTLTTEARTGADVVRLVAGDPLTVDAVITEVNAIARSHLHIEIVPGLAPAMPSRRTRGCRWAHRTPSPMCATRMWIGRRWPRRPVR